MSAFCTILDSAYLPRAVVLHGSLAQHANSFRLYVLCADATVARALERLQLPSVEPIPLEALEQADRELEEVKAGRTTAEYCWTAKSSLCRYLLGGEFGLEEVTYLDSDLMFHADPRLLLDELGDGSVMLVRHRFSPEHPEWTAADGVFNAGWVTFANDVRAREALDWWRARCIEWCFDRREDGRYTDQKYLERLPQLFDGVRVMQHPGGGLAPWNASQHTLTRAAGGVAVDGEPVVFYHYQSLKLVRPSVPNRLFARVTGQLRPARHSFPALWWVDPYYGMSASEIELLWRPYVQQLLEAIDDVGAVEPSFEVQWAELRDLDWREAVSKALKRP